MQRLPSTPWAQSDAYLAHEVNQPLMAILFDAETALGWLDKEPPNLEAARRAVEHVIVNGQRGDSIVRSVRALCRGSSPAMADIDLRSVVDDVLDLIRPRLCRYGIAVDVELAASVRPVRGDRGQLERVVTNLVANAIEAMSAVKDRGRELRIGIRPEEEGTVLVAIEDSGTGVDPSSIERIFEPSFTTKRDGMGLGLSICRSIIEAHGGRLWAAANFSHGSTFSFTLPMARCG
jgi:signal transduction histidine kinase